MAGGNLARAARPWVALLAGFGAGRLVDHGPLAVRLVLLADLQRFELLDELIEIADTRRPFIKNESYHFSISHCGDFAAAIVSRVNRVGVDIELVTPMIEKVQYKFLSEAELLLVSEQAKESRQNPSPAMVETTSNQPHTTALELHTSNLPWLTLLWSAKEAIYKWYADGLVDFKQHIQYTGVHRKLDDNWIELSFLFKKEKPVPLKIRARFFGLLVVSYVQP